MSSSASSRRSYHHGDLRNVLVEQARALAEEVGPEHLTVRSLAARAGVSHAAAYHHFADKNAILRAVAVEAFADLRQRMRAAADSPDAMTAFIGMAQAYLGFALERRAAFKFMWSPELCMPPGEPDPLETAQRGLAADIDEVLAPHKDRLRPTDERLPMLALWSMVHGYTLIVVDTPAFKGAPPQDLQGIAAALIVTLTNGLLVP